MKQSPSRREFLTLGAGAALYSLAGCAATGAGKRSAVQGRVRHVGVGAGGMGAADLKALAAHPEVDIVGLADVDRGRLDAALKLYPGARGYSDWREMFRELDGGFDSVSVSTPDHMHAPISQAAMARSKHIYCQKPLTRTVAEARGLRQAAERAGVVTQMGIQNHSASPYQSALKLFSQGHTGPIHEVHVWTDRPAGWWPQGVERPEGSDPIPADLDWNLWLGVAPERPYLKGQYHPFAWRGWLDFGTGAQGDKACHLMDPAIWFLELGSPSSLRSDGPRPGSDTYPDWSRVHYEFPANRHTTRGPLQLTWHDGGRQAPRQLLDDLGAGEVAKNACLFVGTEGALLANPYGPPKLFPEERFAEVAIPQVAGANHWFQFIDACLGKASCSASFEYAAQLTEVALLGNVALSFPHETLRWDARGLRFPSHPEAEALLHPSYRPGWELG